MKKIVILLAMYIFSVGMNAELKAQDYPLLSSSSDKANVQPSKPVKPGSPWRPGEEDGSKPKPLPAKPSRPSYRPLIGFNPSYNSEWHSSGRRNRHNRDGWLSYGDRRDYDNGASAPAPVEEAEQAPRTYFSPGGQFVPFDDPRVKQPKR